jgi:hypothetical protein
MLTITCDTDAEQEQLLTAMLNGRLSAALDALGQPDFQLARREPGRPPRTFAGGSATNTTFVTSGDAPLSGGGGGWGSTHIANIPLPDGEQRMTGGSGSSSSLPPFGPNPSGGNGGWTAPPPITDCPVAGFAAVDDPAYDMCVCGRRHITITAHGGGGPQ